MMFVRCYHTDAKLQKRSETSKRKGDYFFYLLVFFAFLARKNIIAFSKFIF